MLGQRIKNILDERTKQSTLYLMSLGMVCQDTAQLSFYICRKHETYTKRVYVQTYTNIACTVFTLGRILNVYVSVTKLRINPLSGRSDRVMI